MVNRIRNFEDANTKKIFMARFKNLAEDLAKELGVDIDSVRDINSNYNLITFNVAFKVKNTKITTKRHSTVFGQGPIQPEEIKVGFKFQLKTHAFTITGFNEKNWKNKVSMVRDDGKLFKASPDDILTYGKRVRK